ncbi:alpha/beta fold hydrolase [Cyanobium sp. NIES-981]|uniref:alpha/beta fold hydrolase n=1 Tax=Cyanobium sp. NIES-981 TaxID=1851505 RepID=UPI0007DCC523|nr:alpha/beta hydrolase [Cyanobium sp. NIES-981]SBO42598.1 Esterase [Cyanobium sp. NIES-981]
MAPAAAAQPTLPGSRPAEERPLIVAAHGWLLAGRLWDRLAARLAPGWELWAPDLPGFGGRERPRGLQPSLASYGAWLAREARERACNGRPVVLMGHSLGGSLALHAAPQLGSQLAGLIQIAVGGGVYQPRPFAQVRRGGAVFLQLRPRWLLRLPGSDALRSPLLADRHAAQGLLACSMRRSAVQQLPALTAGLRVPSLWIAGSRDQVMEPRYVRHLAGYAPQHDLRVLDGAGHLPMLRQPEAVAAVIRPWLEGIEPLCAPGEPADSGPAGPTTVIRLDRYARPGP